MAKSIDMQQQKIPHLQRFWVLLANEKQWYSIMQDCRHWFGKNWQCQGKVRKKLNSRLGSDQLTQVWFEVPDERFMTWIGLKMCLEVKRNA